MNSTSNYETSYNDSRQEPEEFENLLEQIDFDDAEVKMCESGQYISKPRGKRADKSQLDTINESKVTFENSRQDNRRQKSGGDDSLDDYKKRSFQQQESYKIQPQSHKPQVLRCPKCGQLSKTKVTYKVNKNTHKKAVQVCGFGGCFGCFVIPYFSKSYKDAYHHCSTCDHFIGKYHYSYGTDKK